MLTHSELANFSLEIAQQQEDQNFQIDESEEPSPQ